MTTSRDVASAAGVSQATVSRVLSGSTRVSEDTRARVLAAVKETGYQPNLVARAMRTNRSGSVGIVVSEITNPFYPELLEALTAELHRRGLRLVVWNAGTAGSDEAAIAAIQQSLVDGLIFTSATDGLLSLREAAARSAPVVLVNRSVEVGSFDRVLTDNYGGGWLAATYLRRNRRTVAMITGPSAASTSRDRLSGFVDACEDAGVSREDIPVEEGPYSYSAGQRAFSKLAPSLKRGDAAIFCANDILALGVIDAARAAGFRVPEDLWVVGFDDIQAASWSSYNLTTIQQPIRAMAKAAVDLLDRRHTTPANPMREVVFPPLLVVRGSTAHVPPEGQR